MPQHLAYPQKWHQNAILWHNRKHGFSRKFHLHEKISKICFCQKFSKTFWKLLAKTDFWYFPILKCFLEKTWFFHYVAVVRVRTTEIVKIMILQEKLIKMGKIKNLFFPKVFKNFLKTFGKNRFLIFHVLGKINFFSPRTKKPRV